MSNVVIKTTNQPMHVIFPEVNKSLKKHFATNAIKSSGKLGNTVTLATPTNTMGWDTVFAIRLPDVNNAIVKQKASPTNFQNTVVDPDSGITCTTNGNFGPWQIRMGGDGQNLHMAIPITQGTMTNGVKSSSMDNSTAIIELKLGYLPPPQGTIPPTSSGTNHALKVNTSQPDPDQPAVAIVALNFPAGKDPGIITKSLMIACLGDWFNKNLSQFDHVFSTVNLNLLADQKSFQWLKPTYSSYAYTDGHDENSSIFGVLCMTENRSADGLTHEISSGAIPENQKSGFLISVARFMENSVLPGLPAAFKDTPASSFKLINDDSEIINTDGADIKLDGVKFGAITYDPHVYKFDLTVNSNEIITNMKIKVNISPGIDSYINMTTYHTLKLIDKPDGSGEQTLDYEETRPTETDHHNEIAAWVTITEAILAGIVAVVGAVAGVVYKTVVQRIIIAIIVIVIGVIIAAVEVIIEKVVADGVANAMPSINPMIYTATNPITWPTQESRFTLTSATLNGCFQFGGDPHFAQ